MFKCRHSYNRLHSRFYNRLRKYKRTFGKPIGLLIALSRRPTIRQTSRNLLQQTFAEISGQLVYALVSPLRSILLFKPCASPQKNHIRGAHFTACVPGRRIGPTTVVTPLAGHIACKSIDDSLIYC